MSSAATTPPSVDKVDGFSRKSVRKAKQKRGQSSSQFRSQDKPIELVQLPLLKGIKPTIFRYQPFTKTKTFLIVPDTSVVPLCSVALRFPFTMSKEPKPVPNEDAPVYKASKANISTAISTALIWKGFPLDSRVYHSSIFGTNIWLWWTGVHIPLAIEYNLENEFVSIPIVCSVLVRRKDKWKLTQEKPASWLRRGFHL